MIIIRLMGGLGNQMFQYAFAKSMALKLGVPLKLDISLLGENKDVEHLVLRHFDLDVFNLPEEFATSKEITKFNGQTNPTFFQKVIYKLNKLLRCYPLVIQKGHEYNPEQIKAIGKNACIIGRWQNEDFFKDYSDEIKAVFSFVHFVPNDYSLSIAAQFESDYIPVTVQVRRGDYLSNPIFERSIGALNSKYYRDAIELMNKKMKKLNKQVRYFFISDDIEWCKNQFSDIPNSFFVEQEKNKVGYISDLWLLSQSRYSIISNSTFSWWGAWLGERDNSLIIAPKNWIRGNSETQSHIVPSRWIIIDNSFEQIEFK